MNILHLYSGNLYGGVESLLVTLAATRTLRPSLNQSFALCFAGRLADELTGLGAPPVMLPAVRVSRPWTVAIARARLRAALAARPVDAAITHSAWPHAVFAPALAGAGVPVVFLAHDVPTGRHPLERWAARTPPALVLANSRHCQAAVPRLFPGVPSEVFYSPVVPAAVAGNARARLRRSLGAGDADTVILTASRLEPWKGHMVLLEALARLPAPAAWRSWVTTPVQRPQDATYLAELTAAVSRLGLSERVRFLGERRDVPELMAAADLYCQPNVSPEPFGRVFVEALSQRLPVISTAIGGALEIVDANTGVLVPPQDAAALAAALTALLADPARRTHLGAAGPARATALCGPATALARLEELLGRVTMVGQ